MGNTVIDSRVSNPLSAALEYWMKESERKRRDDLADRELKQRSEIAAQQRTLADLELLGRQYGNLKTYSERAKFVASLPEQYRSAFVDPTQVGASASDMAAQVRGERELEAAKQWQPTQFDQSYMNMEGVLGRNPNATWSEAERNRAFMTPEAFGTFTNEGFVAPSEVKRNRAAAGRDVAETEFTKGPKTATEYAQGGKYRAETGKISEETITGRELRDPNSPATKARSQSGGRKSSADVALERANAGLMKLSDQEKRLLTEISGERAGLAAAEKASSPYLKKLEAQLNQTRTLLREGIARRDRIMNGATKAGVVLDRQISRPGDKGTLERPVSRPGDRAALESLARPRTGKFTAINPDTKQTIVSDDGVTWYDAATGKKVE